MGIENMLLNKYFSVWKQCLFNQTWPQFYADRIYVNYWLH